MGTLDHSRALKLNSFRIIAGIILILAGAILFLDRYLKTGWLSLAILPIIGIFLYLWGIRHHQVAMVLAGGLVAGAGLGSVAAWGPSVQIGLPAGIGVPGTPHSLTTQIGLLSLFFGIGWGIVVVTTLAVLQQPLWWAMVPGGVLGGLGACLLFSPLRWTDLVLFLLVGTGLPLLFWGVVSRLIGLLIPGCLLITIGPGIYMAWKAPGLSNTLVQTGMMLIWFALGWAMISISSRLVSHRYIWWPLIPGGILAMVGTGLFIGGDPSHALGFISNTGSIMLVIFGLYLLLMRKGIHH